MAGSPSMPDPPASTGGIGFGVGTAGQMNVTPVHCGPFVNESERKAFEQIKSRLISAPGDGEWLLLTNPAFSATHRLQSDEIDVVAIGPPGVKVIEAKHWTAAWVDRNPGLVGDRKNRRRTSVSGTSWPPDATRRGTPADLVRRTLGRGAG